MKDFYALLYFAVSALNICKIFVCFFLHVLKCKAQIKQEWLKIDTPQTQQTSHSQHLEKNDFRCVGLAEASYAKKKLKLDQNIAEMMQKYLQVNDEANTHLN